MARARFKVYGRFKGGAPMPGTVIIEREAGLMAVRPRGMRRTYELPLNSVAEFVVWHVVKKELHDKKKAKQQKRKERAAAKRAERRL